MEGAAPEQERSAGKSSDEQHVDCGSRDLKTEVKSSSSRRRSGPPALFAHALREPTELRVAEIRQVRHSSTAGMLSRTTDSGMPAFWPRRGVVAKAMERQLADVGFHRMPLAAVFVPGSSVHISALQAKRGPPCRRDSPSAFFSVRLFGTIERVCIL